MYDYIIVGAGLYGCVFAYEATARGKKCLVIDKRNHIGGNIYNEEVNGINIHKYGAHIFHTSNKGIWEYVNRFAEFNNYINSPIANYKGQIYNLPFNMNTFSKLWGVSTPNEAKDIIEKQKRKYYSENPENLEEQAINLVGMDIYQKLIKGYTEKQWGRRCTSLPSFIIKRLPVRFTYNNNYFDDKYQGIPVGGYNCIVNKLLERVDVELSTDFFNKYRDYNKIARKLVFSGMIDEFYEHKFGILEYRSLRFENQYLNETNYQGVAVVNYTDSETPYTRIIEHKHFEDIQTNHTVITREYPVDWEYGDEAYYPINDKKNNWMYSKYRKIADNEPNIIFGGRLGAYKYHNMDQVIFAALEDIEKEME